MACPVCGSKEHDNEPSPSGKQHHVTLPEASLCPNCGHADHEGRCGVEECICPDDIEVSIEHVILHGRCVISINGQGHLPCSEHNG